MTTLNPTSAPLETGVYRCTQQTPHFMEGDLVHVSHQDESGVHLHHLNSSYTFSSEEFHQTFQHLPDGEIRMAQKTAEVMLEIQQVSQEIHQLSHGLSQTTISINRQTGESEGLEMLPLQKGDLKSTKGTLLRVKDQVEKLREKLSSKQKTLEALMRQQMRHAEAALAPIKAMVEKLEETVWTVELYLGRHETVVMLRDGQAAPRETKITIRQQVLAMDQEAAVSVDTGGIDSLSLEAFDQWVVADPAHLDQILPEQKGVVALVPRWKGKAYENPWQQNEADQGNKKTSFLIRNGEKLFRVTTDFFADRTLTPTAVEFLDLFRKYDHVQRRHVQMEPGSRDYMEAEKKQGRRQRDYMRVALILQGLIDRTVVFHPLPEPPLMVTDPGAYESGLLEIIPDAERTLLDGSERFVDWQKRVNGDLEVGRRILGNFGWNFRQMRDEQTHRHPRMWPERAEMPDSHTLYTLERKEKDGFVFLFERTQDVWLPGQGYVRPERRASCRIQPTDSFVLAFDHPDCTMEVLQGFLSRRVEREHYLEMFPLLKAALRLKKQEQEAEMPFKALMVSHATTHFGLEEDQAVQLVDQATERYKFKKKVHRALIETGQETEAFLQVLSELGFLVAEHQNREEKRQNGAFDRVVQQVLREQPQAVLIAHRKENEYTVYVPETEDDNVFMRVLTLKAVRGTLKVTDDQPWKTIGKHHHRWHLLFQGERLKSWKFYARSTEHLTDPEIALLGASVEEDFLAHQRGGRSQEEDHRVVAVTFDLSVHQFRVYHHTLCEARWGGKKSRQLRVSTSRIEKDKEGVRVASWRRSEEPYGFALPWEEPQQDVDSWVPVRRRNVRERMLHLNAAWVQVLQQEQQENSRREALQREHQQKVEWVLQQLHEGWKRHFWQETQEKFMAEYGNMDLWEVYQKMVKLPDCPVRGAHRKAMHVVAAHVVEHPGLCPCTVADVQETLGRAGGPSLDVPEVLRSLVIEMVVG